MYAKGDQIDHFTLFELHGWTCIICRNPINRHLRLPNWFAATVEHIVPLAQGGTHTWDNVAPAHYKCNMTKGDSLMKRQAGILAL